MTRKTLPVFLCVLALPMVAMAGYVNPLEVAATWHLTIGNFSIGVFEGLVLAKCFKLHKLKTMGLLIAANYFSAWVGGVGFNNCVQEIFPLTLHNARIFFWCMAVVTYFLTLLLEIPFIAWALRKDPKWRSKAIYGALITHTLPCVLLFGWYEIASDRSLYTQTKMVTLSEISLPEKILVYFISTEDGNVYSMNLDGTEKQKIHDLPSKAPCEYLIFRFSRNANQRDLKAHMRTGNYTFEELLIQSINEECVPKWSNAKSRSSFSSGPRLGSAEKSPWVFTPGHGELRGEHHMTGEYVYFAYETIFGSGNVKNVTLLPDEKVLFQLWEQICIFDIATRRISVITNGRSPVAVLK